MAADLESGRSSTEPSNTSCLICKGNTNMGVSEQNAISIFQNLVLSTKRTVLDVIDDVFSKTNLFDDFHSIVVCRRCYESLHKVEIFENRLASLKSKIAIKFRHTLQRKSGSVGIQNMDTINTEQKADMLRPADMPKPSDMPKSSDTPKPSDMPKPVENREHHHNIKEKPMSITISNTITMQNESHNTKNKNQDRCSLDQNVLHVLEDDMDKIEDKALTFARSMEAHNIMHTYHRPFICHICGEIFGRFAEIEDHHKHVHTNKTLYKCEFCVRMFSKISQLQSHKRATHSEDIHVKAAETGKKRLSEFRPVTINFKKYLKQYKNIHTEKKLYSCEVCGKAFNNLAKRDVHSFEHSDKMPYECSVCGAGYKGKLGLHKHMTRADHLHGTIVENMLLKSSSADKEEFQQDIQTLGSDSEMELAMVVNSDGNQMALSHMTEEEREKCPKELKEHTLQPVKHDFKDNLVSFGQTLINTKHQVQCTIYNQPGNIHTMDHRGDDGYVVDVRHMEIETVSIGHQEHGQTLMPATCHFTFNESNM